MYSLFRWTYLILIFYKCEVQNKMITDTLICHDKRLRKQAEYKQKLISVAYAVKKSQFQLRKKYIYAPYFCFI